MFEQGEDHRIKYNLSDKDILQFSEISLTDKTKAIYSKTDEKIKEKGDNDQGGRMRDIKAKK